MKLEIPEVTSRHYAKQVVEAMLDTGSIGIADLNDPDCDWCNDSEQILDILFKEEE